MTMFERARAKRARDLHPPLPTCGQGAALNRPAPPTPVDRIPTVPPPSPAPTGTPAAGGHAAGTITTPLEAVCAVHVALRLTYGDDAGRIWRLSGARVPADWRPDTAHEDLVAHSARLVRT